MILCVLVSTDCAGSRPGPPSVKVPQGRTVTVSFPTLPAGTKGIRLDFYKNCGTVQVVGGSAFPPGPSSAGSRLRPRLDGESGETGSITLEWEQPFAADLAPELLLEFTGELLAIRAWDAWDDAMYHVEGRDWATVALEREQDLWTWRRERERAPHEREKQFFNDMDYLKPLEAQPEDVLRALKNRLKTRQDDPDPSSEITADLRTRIELEARSMKSLFRSAFDEPGLSDDDFRTRVADALDLFSRGELSLLDSTDDADLDHWLACQPNTAYLYYFAEFADLCVEAGVDAEFWEALRRPFVHAIIGFLDTYVTVTRDWVPQRGEDGKLCGFLYVRQIDRNRTTARRVDRATFVNENRDEETFRVRWQSLANQIDFDCDESTIRLADSPWR